MGTCMRRPRLHAKSGSEETTVDGEEALHRGQMQSAPDDVVRAKTWTITVMTDPGAFIQEAVIAVIA